MVQLLSSLALAMSMATTVLAHPGGDVMAEVAARERHLKHPERRTLASCKRSLEKRGGHYESEISRRMEKIGSLRMERGLDATIGPLEQRQDRANCVLDPEVTEGPFCKSS